MKLQFSILLLMMLTVTTASAKDDITKELITSNGKTRAYYLYVPSTARAESPVPLIVFGHSAGASFALEISLMESEYFAATAIHAGALPSEAAGRLIEMAKRKIPMFIQVGDSDQYFPLKVVRATRDDLVERGFKVELTEIPRHDHWYYDMAPKINLAAWEFLKKYELDREPVYRKFTFN